MQVVGNNDHVGKWMILNDDPLIQVVDHFISAETCDYFIEQGEPKLGRAFVSGETGGKISSGRTGSNCWLAFKDDPRLNDVSKEISEYIKIPLDHAEAMQLIYYGSGQEYKPHFDAFDLKSDRGIRCTKNGGQRLITALLYLNDVQKGGGTIFPKLNIIVEAKMGRVLLFENTLLNDSTRHPLSLHGGLPVEEGEKWAVNLWFRQFSRRENKKPVADSSKASACLSASGNEQNIKNQIDQIDQNRAVPPKLNEKSSPRRFDFESVDSNVPVTNNEQSNESNAVDLDQTRYWIAKCLIMGLKEDYIYGVLLEVGLKKQWIDSEIQLALDSPYIKAGCKVIQNFTRLSEAGLQEGSTRVEDDPEKKRAAQALSELPIGKLEGHSIQYASSRIPPQYDQQFDHACNNNILIIPDFISSELAEFADQVVSEGSSVPSKRGKRVKPKEKIRDDYFFKTDDCSPFDAYLFASVVKIARDHYGCELGFRERWKVGHYTGEKQGFYIPHSDTAGEMKHRMISCVVMLSSPDDYTGGELVFPEHGKELKLSQFSAAIFPSGILHGVKPVLSGVRQTLLSFAWSASNMQNMPKNPLDYLPRVKLNFENAAQFVGVEIIDGKKNDPIETRKSAA